MKFSQWLEEKSVAFGKAGDGYEALQPISKTCIDNAIERFIEFRQAEEKKALPDDLDIEIEIDDVFNMINDNVVCYGDGRHKVEIYCDEAKKRIFNYIKKLIK